MPFVSEQQRKLCYTLYNQDIKAGRKPTWNCYEWEKKTRDSLPRKKGCCKGRTIEGKKCKRKAEPGKQYCWQHM